MYSAISALAQLSLSHSPIPFIDIPPCLSSV